MAPVESAISLDLQGENGQRTFGNFKYNENYQPIKLLSLKVFGIGGNYKEL